MSLLPLTRSAALWAALAAAGAGAAFAMSSPEAGQKEYFCEDIRKPFFAETPAGSGLFRAARPQATPGAFRMPKPADAARAFVVGESVAAILDQGSYALEETALNNWLGRVFPDRKLPPLEILNCGMGGYESYRISGVLKEVLAYSPDLAVILSGNHEGSPEYLCPGLDFELRRRKLKLFERLYSLKNSPSRARKLASLKLHGEMLAAMVRGARKAGVPVVLATLPANLRDMTSRTPLPFHDRGFSAGYRHYYGGRYSAAEDAFRAGLRALPENPHLHFYLARALEKLDRKEESWHHYARAAEVDGDMTRADAERNALIRRVAAEEGACLADLEGLFRRLAPDGQPGFGEFRDGMHWRRPYNRLVWEELFRAARACGVGAFAGRKAYDHPAWKETRRGDALVRLNYAASWMLPGALPNEASVAELAYIRAQDPGLLEELSRSKENFKAAIKRVFWAAPLLARADEVYPSLLAHIAEAERRAGADKKTLDLCGRALALRGEDRSARFVRAQALAEAGRLAEAAADFRAAGPDAEGLAREYGLTEKAR